MKVNIYLAHAISSKNKNSQVGDIKEYLQKKLNIIGDIYWQGEKVKIDIVDPEDYGLDDAVNHAEIVRRNCRDISRSHLMVVDGRTPSFGTGAEMVLAKSLNIPIVALIPFENKASAWVYEYADDLCYKPHNIPDSVVRVLRTTYGCPLQIVKL